jgi:hypothetical protein
MVVARPYVRLSYEDIALILSVNDPDRDRYEQRINGEPPTPFDATNCGTNVKSFQCG